MLRSLLNTAVLRRSCQATTTVSSSSAATTPRAIPANYQLLSCSSIVSRGGKQDLPKAGANQLKKASVLPFAGLKCPSTPFAGFQKRHINHLGSQSTMASRLDQLVHQKYMALPTPGKVMATYIWIDGTGQVSGYHANFLVASFSQRREKGGGALPLVCTRVAHAHLYVFSIH